MMFDLPHELVELDKLRQRLHRRFPQQFTFALDGRLLGDIGEGIASEIFGIKLSRGVGVDGKIGDRYVQIKCTASNNGPQFRYLEDRKAYYLVFLSFDINNGIGRVVFNGPERIATSKLPIMFTKPRNLTMRQMIDADAEVDQGERLVPIQEAIVQYNIR